MATIKHTFTIAAPPAKVYQALSTLEGLADWWTADTTGNPKTGGKLRFAFEEDSNVMKVIRTEKNKFVAWRCIESSFIAGKEWLGTEVTFSLTTDEDKNTLVRFEHAKWKKATDFYGVCTYHWGLFMTSLKALCETGQGKPFGTKKDEVIAV